MEEPAEPLETPEQLKARKEKEAKETKEFRDKMKIDEDKLEAKKVTRDKLSGSYRTNGEGSPEEVAKKIDD